MEVILFYALLIGGIGLVFAAYVALLVVPIGLIVNRFGLLGGAGFAAVMAAVLYATFEPPFGGANLSFVPAGMVPNLFIVGLVQEPPVTMIIASAIVSAAGFTLLILARLFRRAQAASRT